MALSRILSLALAVGILSASPCLAAEATAGDDRWLWLPRRNAWLAASLSLGFNGLGQLYNGESEKGLGMMAGWLAFPLAHGVDALTGGSYLRLFAFSANVGIKIWSVTDAWSVAQFAANAPLPSPSPLLSSPPPQAP